ncbi:DUF7577 domain-containing protein [Halovenus marina]|uniref:DUF7577 domain-containing protein n=1 Tax=Halovenus marina TaxID=3396621 RepID=UPI003F57AF70
MSPDWVIGVLSVLLLVHIFVVTYALVKRGWLRFDGEYSVRAQEASAPEDGVRCPRCNTENDIEYRYCRNCVNELPAQLSLGNDSSGVQGRRTL